MKLTQQAEAEDCRFFRNHADVSVIPCK